MADSENKGKDRIRMTMVVRARMSMRTRMSTKVRERVRTTAMVKTRVRATSVATAQFGSVWLSSIWLNQKGTS